MPDQPLAPDRFVRTRGATMSTPQDAEPRVPFYFWRFFLITAGFGLLTLFVLIGYGAYAAAQRQTQARLAAGPLAAATNPDYGSPGGWEVRNSGPASCTAEGVFLVDPEKYRGPDGEPVPK